MKNPFFLLAIASVNFGFFGCGGSSSEAIPVGGFERQEINVPFIESLEFPEGIIAGEEFKIRVTLSSQLHPNVLTGGDNPDSFAWIRFPYASPDDLNQEINLEDWYGLNVGNAYFFENNNLTGEPKTEYFISGRVYFSGEYVFYIYAAESREFGGYSTYTIEPEFNIYPREHVALFEFPYTVLPAPDAEE